MTSESRPMPDFPSRRSLHGEGADPHALERALDSVREAMTGMIPLVGRSASHSAPASAPSPTPTPSNEPAHRPPRSAAPQRRSLRERFAEIAHSHEEAELSTPPTPSLGIPVGSGTMSLPGDSFSHALTGAYSIMTEGVFDKALTDTGLVPVIDVLEEGAPISRDQALSHHVFLVPDGVGGDEIEALAVSIWDEAAWAMPGTLRLVGEAYLRGPWRVDEAVRAELGIAPDLCRAWILETPRVRSMAAPPSAVEPPAHQPAAPLGTAGGQGSGAERGSGLQPVVSADPWAQAFPQGVPFGLEYKALLALVRMARRLGGALRISGSGFVWAPVPESAVHMGVYASRWVEPEQMRTLLSAHYQGVVDSRELSVQQPVAPSAQEVRRVQSVMAGAKPLSPEVERVLRQAREEAARQPQRVDGYALMIPYDDGGHLMVEVHRVMRPPRVLRWEPWTNSVIVEYAIRWQPAAGPAAFIPAAESNPSPERLAACAQAGRAIDALAGIVAQATGGTIVDEDGFLVGKH